MTRRGRPALPLGVRNRLAELILDAFDRPESGLVLEALAAFCAADAGRVDTDTARRLADLGWIEPAGAGRFRLRGLGPAQGAALRERVAAARALWRAVPEPSDGGSIPGLFARAALLADAGLYFEVHELLEPAWIRAEGAERLGLQALIQVAVAFHHADHGNDPGAISLLAEGLAKLDAARAALPLETAEWESALTEILTALREGRPRPRVPAWPRPRGVSGDGSGTRGRTAAASA
jgi:hypothetical protein